MWPKIIIRRWASDGHADWRRKCHRSSADQCHAAPAWTRDPRNQRKPQNLPTKQSRLRTRFAVDPKRNLGHLMMMMMMMDVEETSRSWRQLGWRLNQFGETKPVDPTQSNCHQQQQQQQCPCLSFQCLASQRSESGWIGLNIKLDMLWLSFARRSVALCCHRRGFVVVLVVVVVVVFATDCLA